MAERVKHTSKLGELSWVFITGKGKRNFNDDGDIYSATISLVGDAAKKTIEEIEAFYEEHKTKGVKKGSMGYYHPYVFDKAGEKIPLKDDKGEVIEDKYEQDKDTVCITYKTGITFPDGSPKVIQVYNSKGDRVSLGETRIGNGSTGCAAGQMSMFQRPKLDEGVTFYLNSVQVVTLSPFTGGDKFEAHEGGFEGVDTESGIPVETKVEEKSVSAPKL